MKTSEQHADCFLLETGLQGESLQLYIKQHLPGAVHSKLRPRLVSNLLTKPEQVMQKCKRVSCYNG
eukprot:scaffold265360_cov23-Tisochrysis_lutea.AAC.1